MKRKFLFFGLAFLTLTGCQTQNQTNGAVAGGVMGGILGTGVGILTHNPAAGMAIGAGTGALVGTAVGANKDQQQAKAAATQAQAYAAQNPPLTLPQVVQMANNGTPEAIIIQQMQTTNSYYNLTPDDIAYLTNAHVSPNVILVMQQRRIPPPVVVGPRPAVVYDPYYAPPPVAIGVGVGPGYYRRY